MTDATTLDKSDLLLITGDIVSAYVANNKVEHSGLAGLISDVYSAVSNLGKVAPAPVEEKLVPAVPVKKSITPDFIVCLEDGKKFKSLKRHLRSAYDMSPDQYRAKWGLPAEYPMVAPSYAEARSQLAKKMGLGQQRAKQVRAAQAAAKTPKTTKGKAAKKTSTAA